MMELKLYNVSERDPQMVVDNAYHYKLTLEMAPYLVIHFHNM